MIDLHTHSTFSDGSFTPEQLVQEAEKIPLTALALTDHDNIGGIERFMTACANSSVRGVPGVEISLDCPEGTMHLLGYFIDHRNGELQEHIAKLKTGRVARNEDMIRKLNSLGVPLTLNEVATFAGEDNIGRLHFALALLARGYVKTTQEAFTKYLAKGKPGYTDRLRMTPARGIEIIRHAGGLAALAHPFTMNLGKQALTALVGDLAAVGLQGIEIYYPQQSPRQVKLYRAIARQFQLAATGGTDFHGAPLPDIQLGRGFGNLNVPDAVLDELNARHKPNA